jgi:DNA-binding transcriptional ArsR family regulator
MHVDDNCCDMFKALSVKTRVKILELLKDRGPLGPKKIAAIIGVTPAAVSQHLRVLKAAGLVYGERKGYRIPYGIDVKAMESCRHKLAQVCSCRPGDAGGTRGRAFRGGELSLKGLERYKRNLEEELTAVKERIKRIRKEKAE